MGRHKQNQLPVSKVRAAEQSVGGLTRTPRWKFTSCAYKLGGMTRGPKAQRRVMHPADQPAQEYTTTFEGRQRHRPAAEAEAGRGAGANRAPEPEIDRFVMTRGTGRTSESHRGPGTELHGRTGGATEYWDICEQPLEGEGGEGGQSHAGGVDIPAGRGVHRHQQRGDKASSKGRSTRSPITARVAPHPAGTLECHPESIPVPAEPNLSPTQVLKQDDDEEAVGEKARRAGNDDRDRDAEGGEGVEQNFCGPNQVSWAALDEEEGADENRAKKPRQTMENAGVDNPAELGGEDDSGECRPGPGDDWWMDAAPHPPTHRDVEQEHHGELGDAKEADESGGVHRGDTE